MDHHQVKRSLVLGQLPAVVWMLDRKEVFIKRNVEFRGKDLLRIKGVIASKLLQDFSCLVTSALHQGVEYFEVRGAPRSDEVIDVGCQDLVDFNPSCCRLGFPQPCALDMLANVERLTRHVAIPRLAQRWDGFSFAYGFIKRLCLHGLTSTTSDWKVRVRTHVDLHFTW